MAEFAGEKHIATINAVLRIALRHPNLLQRQAFQELVTAVGAAVPAAQIALTLPDGPGYQRIYAISQGPGEAVLPFGVRFAVDTWPANRIYTEAEPYYCDDLRQGDELGRMAATAGYLSYVAVPARAAGGVRGGLLFSFTTCERAREAPIGLMQEIADVIGENLERVVKVARERRLAMILETSGDAMLAWDRQFNVTDVNESAVRLTGRPRAELIGTNIFGILGPQTNQNASTPPPFLGVRMELVRRTSGPASGEPRGGQGATTIPPSTEPRSRQRTSSLPPSSEQRVTVAATITQVDDDPLVAAHVLLRDLSHVVAAERQAALRRARIRELEEQHRTLLDNAPLIIFRLDPKSTELVYLNRHAERLLGVPTTEALGTPGFLRNAHADPEGVEAFDNAVARAKSGAESLPYEARLRRRRGESITARGTVYPLLSERGEVVAIEGVLADVSAEHVARTRLVQTDRLSTLGMLAAGVAHEINNPAAFLLLGVDMLDRLLTGPGVQMDPSAKISADNMLAELRDSIRRIVDIARDLRLFASPPSSDSGRWAVVDVNRTVESALTLTRGQIIERAQIVRHIEDVPPVLMGDGRLGQVIVNLLVNAAQAIPRTFPSDHAITVTTRSDGDTVEIEVRDTGVGISPENLSRIWAPFFTTKSSDVGTGLGLSISREIVEQAGGSIWAESPAPGTDPPSGSRFVISLPAAGSADVSAVTRQSSMPPSKQPGLRASVLLVEDEAALARVLADEIGAAHEVTIADGGAAALALLAKQRFDVVLCDLRMPGMSGDTLYTRVAESDPAQAQCFIFMTGVGFGAGVERFLASSGRPVLEKPFSSFDALSAIAKVALRNRRSAGAITR